eukprot:2392497-Pyramimonas_sp.AAC.1
MFARAPSAPGRPWSAVLARDEVAPGSVLRPRNRRNIVAFYISFIELGRALRREFSRLPLGMVRSAQVEKVRGGLAGAHKWLARRLLLEDGNR